MCFSFFKKKKKAEPQKVAAVKEEKKVVKPQQESKAELAKPAKAEPNPEAKTEAAKKANATYHVSQNKDEKSENYKRWRVRKAGSTKTVKYFDTQKEAIDYAKELSDKNDGNVTIHKLDGTIRKQDYSKEK